MVKFKNLDWNIRRKIESEYDKRHIAESPQLPEFEPIEQQPRNIIETDYKTDLYCAIGKRYLTVTPGQTASNISGYMRLVASNEHIEIELKQHVIGQIIDELIKLKNDVDAYNSRVEIYNAQLKEYQQAKEAYTERRDNELEKLFSTGKYTEAQAKNGLDDIPF